MGLKDLKSERSVPVSISATEKKQSSSLLSSAATNRKESREPSVNPKKRRSQKFCSDCGQKDHVRGDSGCKSPNLYTKNLRKKRKFKDSARKGNNGNAINFSKGAPSSEQLYFWTGGLF